MKPRSSGTTRRATPKRPGCWWSGGIVALPTDTVYGIGVALDAPRGIDRLFEAQRRPADRAIMLLLDSAEQAKYGARPSPRLRGVLLRGPHTVVDQPPDAGLPTELTAGIPTITWMPDYACPRALAAAVGPLPVTATLAATSSATPARLPTSSAMRVPDCIVDGGPGPRRPGLHRG